MFKTYLTLPRLRHDVIHGVIFAAALLFGTTALAQTPQQGTAKGVLYEVKSATNTAYLFGSIHLAKASFYPLPEAVEKAYRNADVVAVEVDVSDPAVGMKMMPFFMYKAPDKLEQHVSKATWLKIQTATGPAAQMFQPMKPVTLTTAITVGMFTQQGYDPHQGIDLHFTKRAKADKKTLLELETLESQAKLLGSVNDEDGDAMLSQFFDDYKSGELSKYTNKMLQAWGDGDAVALAAVMREGPEKDAGSKNFMKAMLDDRNVGMAQKITQSMERGDKLFAVVGAGHLVGENSVVDLLTKQGLQIKQVK